MRLSILHSKAANSPCFRFPFLKAVEVAAQRRLPFRAVGAEVTMAPPYFGRLLLAHRIFRPSYGPVPLDVSAVSRTTSSLTVFILHKA